MAANLARDTRVRITDRNSIYRGYSGVVRIAPVEDSPVPADVYHRVRLDGHRGHLPTLFTRDQLAVSDRPAHVQYS